MPPKKSEVLGHLHSLARQYPKQNTGVDNLADLLSPDQSDFIDWLVSPEKDCSQTEWCRQRDINPTTATGWKKLGYFRKVWQERHESLVGSPERVQNILDALYSSARNGDVPAAKTYLSWVDRSAPPRKPQAEAGTVRDMTDEELEGHLRALQERRAKGA